MHQRDECWMLGAFDSVHAACDDRVHLRVDGDFGSMSSIIMPCVAWNRWLGYDFELALVGSGNSHTATFRCSLGVLNTFFPDV